MVCRTRSLLAIRSTKISTTFHRKSCEWFRPCPARSMKRCQRLEEDHGFLLKGDVFSEELIETFISYKRRAEAEAVRLRPHPYEFALYYDI